MFVKIKLESMGNLIKNLMFLSIFLVSGFGTIVSAEEQKKSQKTPLPDDVSYMLGVFPTFSKNRIDNLELMMFVRKFFAKNIGHSITPMALNDGFVYRLMAFFNLYHTYIGDKTTANDVFDVSSFVKDKINSSDKFDRNEVAVAMTAVNNEAIKAFYSAGNDICVMKLPNDAIGHVGFKAYGEHSVNEYECARKMFDNADAKGIFDKIKEDPDFKKMCEEVKGKHRDEQLRRYAEWLAKHCKNASDAHDKTPSIIWSMYKVLFDYKYGSYIRWGLFGLGIYLVWTYTKEYLEKMLKPANTAIDGPLL